MDVIALDMYTTAGAGVIALLLGVFLTRKLPALGRMCIPAPVTGGLAVSLLFLLLHVAFGWRFSFDGTVKDLCMLVFFTSVGFQSDLRMLRAGGKPLVVMIGLVSLLIVAQNLLSLGIARGLHIDPLVGMATGSIPMCGGHGTAGGFAPVLAQMGLQGADSIAMAAATFGLVAGSMVGGPVGEFLVRRHRLAEASGSDDVVSTLGGEVPEGLELYSFPAGEWAVFTTRGPMPDSLQTLNTAVWQEWFPNEGQKYHANGNATLEVYSAGNPQSPDYECGIWVPISGRSDEYDDANEYEAGGS